MSFDSQDNINLKSSIHTFDPSAVEYYSFNRENYDPLLSQTSISDQGSQTNQLANQQLSVSNSLNKGNSTDISNKKNHAQSLQRSQAIAAVQKRVSLQMSAKLHRAAKLAALDEDETLNSLMIRLLRHYLSQKQNAS